MEDAKPSIGQNSLHADSNDNGECLINFAASQRMVIEGTIFQHKNTHKATWGSSDGNTSNQIFHVLHNTAVTSYMCVATEALTQILTTLSCYSKT
jgi:hypothetical protein